MAVPSNVKTTAIAIGNREDLSDTTVRIYADEMPMLAMAGTGKANAVDADWLTTEIRSGALGNAQPEGATARTTAAKTRTRLRNKCQIFDEMVSVSGTQEAVKKAAIRSEYKEQTKLKTIELNLDREATYCSAQGFAEQTGTNAGEGRKMSGVQCFVTVAAHSDRGTGGLDGAIDANGYATAPTAGTNRAFTEAQLKGVLLAMYQSGSGGNKTLLMGASLKEAAASFGGTVPNRQMVGSSKVTVTSSIDFYKGNYGLQKVQAHQSAFTNECLIIKDDIIEVAKLRGLNTDKLAKNGDSREAQMVCEDTLKVKNPKGLGIVADVTPT